ncbi:hypothetical protein PPYR_07112 [Photinus pyralis]|uniref:Knr4/Smi1-like domain-containing protein n=2 Tax=Photinus pyralis TaxID=7054 RepID=A0A5N4APF6_PHOPY|nr:tubulin polyglutamylase complex subunit 2-like [Photinus pyralis]KAB0799232.1 hypothetical protein PPYR_07112 [Photinus pyralis]
MRCIIETITEFTYLENILMGLSDALKKKLGIHNLVLRKFPLASATDISAWEQRNGVQMPQDLHAFYSSSDGFNFEWTHTYDGDADNTVNGSIKINSLHDMVPIFGFQTSMEPGVRLNTERYEMKLSIESRLFILDTIPQRGHVVLVYLYPIYVPTIWLLTADMALYFLANDVATYLRMAISHLGISNWQFIYTPNGVPQWTENVIRQLAPHLLPLNKSIERVNREREIDKSDNCAEIPVNRLDPNLFESCPRISTVPIPILLPNARESEKCSPRKKALCKPLDQVCKPRTRMSCVKKSPK